MKLSPTSTQQAESPGLVSPWSLVVFSTWTVTSFLCHHFAKVFLRQTGSAMSKGDHQDFAVADLSNGVITAGVLTSVQMGLCLLLVNVEHPDRGHRLAVARACHVIATWFTNLSMACMFASSTFAIKLMEPITSAVVQYMMLGTPLSPLAVLSLPVIVGGAIIFSGNPFTRSNLSFGIATAFASNVVLAFRNASLKANSSQKQGGVTMILRPISHTIVGVVFICLGFVGLVWGQGLVSDHVIYATATCVLSGVFHVIYSYVSTGVVLLHLSVVSHAVTNILKRVLVLLLLYMTGSRIASLTNFLGLVVCMLGLFIYTWSKRSTHARARDSGEVTGATIVKKTRRKFAVITSVLLISVFGVGVMKKDLSEIRSAAYDFRALVSSSADIIRQDRSERTFTNAAHDIPPVEDLLPNMDGYLAPLSRNITAFLQEDLFANPNRSSFLSKQLRTPSEISNEAQRLHFDVLGKILAPYKYAMLLGIASFENKGDPCITVGETYFLARIKLEIVYYCAVGSCNNANLKQAGEKAKQYSPEELAILVHGGGNIVGYAFADVQRFIIFREFKNYQIFIFPQSVWIKDFNFNTPHFKRCAEAYCCNENVTFVMRDHLSYSIAKEHFAGASKFILLPDMVFQFGPVSRVLSPVFDIMWIKRTDKETPNYTSIPDPPPGIRIHVSDWWKWKTPWAPTSLERAHYMCTNGFFYLQRGRVIITDRLHGHILATLMNIPHVLIDNKAHKLSAYHLSWTAGLDNTVITSDPSKAVDLAMELLARFNSSLPPRVPFLHIDEKHGKDNTFNKSEVWYT